MLKANYPYNYKKRYFFQLQLAKVNKLFVSLIRNLKFTLIEINVGNKALILSVLHTLVNAVVGNNDY